MKTCTYAGDTEGLARSHPYTHATSNEDFRYLDLRAEPERIRTSLEDFLAWSGYPAVETFYGLLEALNAAGSTLESNDCAFSPPEADPDALSESREVCSGRLMVLFRDVPRNLSESQWDVFLQALHTALSRTDPDFELGMIGTTLVPVRFRALPASARDGQQLMISFWAWGSDERGCMDNLSRLMTNLTGALLDLARG